MSENASFEWPEQVRVLDHQNSHSRWADARAARRLFASGGFRLIWRKNKVVAIKASSTTLMSAREIENIEPMRRRGAGDSHRRETYFNPQGVWTINGISESVRPIFTTVVDGCLRAA